MGKGESQTLWGGIILQSLVLVLIASTLWWWVIGPKYQKNETVSDLVIPQGYYEDVPQIGVEPWIGAKKPNPRLKHKFRG